MNLYKISQIVNTGWDTYDSAVVAAETEEAARNTHPDVEYGDFDVQYDWAMPEDVTVELIGLAIEGTTAGVIVASFNAG